MFRWAMGIAVLFFAIGASAFWQLYSSAIRASEASLLNWKKSEWLRSGKSDLWTRALIAAEDPFFSDDNSNCGMWMTLRTLIWVTSDTKCSPIISYAARLAISEKYFRPARRAFAELSVGGSLANRPEEAIEIVLNKAYLGLKPDGFPIEGFSQAAQFYFAKPVTALKISQAALLAGMVNAPSRYNPLKDPESAQARRNWVIDQMLKSGFVSEAEAAESKNDRLD